MISRLIRSRMSCEEFCNRFLFLWRGDRDEEYKAADSFSQRKDLILLKTLHSGEISGAEFHREWTELFGYSSQEKFRYLLNDVFSACNSFPIRDMVASDHEYAEAEHTLRSSVALSYKEYEEKTRMSVTSSDNLL
jgi:hypothetical protein